MPANAQPKPNQPVKFRTQICQKLVKSWRLFLHFKLGGKM